MHALGLERDRPAARERLEAEPALGDAAAASAGRSTRPFSQCASTTMPSAAASCMTAKRDVVVGHDAELDVGQPQLDAADARARRRRAGRPGGTPRGSQITAWKARSMCDSGSSSASVRRAASAGRSPGSGVDEGERRRRPAAAAPSGCRRGRRRRCGCARRPPRAGRGSPTRRSTSAPAAVDLPDRGDHAVARPARPPGAEPSGPTTVPPTIAVATLLPTARSGRHGAAPSSRRV